jgi:hypothetical protein
MQKRKIMLMNGEVPPDIEKPSDDKEIDPEMKK